MESKFLGQTKGHSGKAVNLTAGDATATGESHSGGPSSQFIGTTKGNRDLPIDRSAGMSEGHGGGQFKGGK